MGFRQRARAFLPLFLILSFFGHVIIFAGIAYYRASEKVRSLGVEGQGAASADSPENLAKNATELEVQTISPAVVPPKLDAAAAELPALPEVTEKDEIKVPPTQAPPPMVAKRESKVKPVVAMAPKKIETLPPKKVATKSHSMTPQSLKETTAVRVHEPEKIIEPSKMDQESEKTENLDDIKPVEGFAVTDEDLGIRESVESEEKEKVRAKRDKISPELVPEPVIITKPAPQKPSDSLSDNDDNDTETKREYPESHANVATSSEKVTAVAAGEGGSQDHPAYPGQGVGSIRSAEGLRAMPNNPRPKYDSSERLAGHQGEVIFHTYINASGEPTEIRLIQSSGYRNLDLKSMNALKKNRFYPGQEGWAEMPFKWALKGEPEAIKRPLRDKAQLGASNK